MSVDGSMLLDVDNLTVEYEAGPRRPRFRAVDRVSFSVARKETLGIVGESGSGKTTLSRAILGLTPPADGTIAFAGKDITRASYRERRALSTQLQAVFQDPYRSLNPARTIRQSLAEAVRNVENLPKPEVNERVTSMLGHVGLPPDAANRFPIHFSGGQRQRIAIARALMARPQLVICDEPVSALDLSVQAHILNLLRSLQEEFELSYVFIAHDLAVVRNISHRILVMYHGQIMEYGDAELVYQQPAHPYTRALLEAAPVPDPEVQRKRRTTSAASAPRAATVRAQGGCSYAHRCPHVIDECISTRPELEPTSGVSSVACHRWRDLAIPSAIRA